MADLALGRRSPGAGSNLRNNRVTLRPPTQPVTRSVQQFLLCLAGLFYSFISDRSRHQNVNVWDDSCVSHASSIAARKLTVEPPSNPSASALLATSAPNALYNFRLLEALRSDDPSKVDPFLQELGGGQDDDSKAGRLLGMAVKVASGGCDVRCARKSRMLMTNGDEQEKYSW